MSKSFKRWQSGFPQFRVTHVLRENRCDDTLSTTHAHARKFLPESAQVLPGISSFPPALAMSHPARDPRSYNPAWPGTVWYLRSGSLVNVTESLWERHNVAVIGPSCWGPCNRSRHVLGGSRRVGLVEAGRGGGGDASHCSFFVLAKLFLACAADFMLPLCEA